MNQRIIGLTAMPVALLLTHIAAKAPAFTESIYARGVYRPLSLALSTVTGFAPVSVAEIIVVGSVICIAVVFIKLIRGAFSTPAGKTWLVTQFVLVMILTISVVYLGFVLFWGLNYYRLPFAHIAGLEVRPAPVSVLVELCKSLIDEANRLRAAVPEDSNGVMKVLGSRASVLSRASAGYAAVSPVYPQLGGRYGHPKGVYLSRIMSYAGISGVYFPFTFEANVNMEVPDSVLPSTVCHEMAHQRGFAREDEANYIAYLVCRAHPDPDFQYSGTVLALMHSMNALARQDPGTHRMLREKYSDGLKRDLAHHDSFWKRFEGPFERVSSKINDSYLKANGQADGTASYGRMVDLLIAEFVARKAR